MDLWIFAPSSHDLLLPKGWLVALQQWRHVRNEGGRWREDVGSVHSNHIHPECTFFLFPLYPLVLCVDLWQKRIQTSGLCLLKVYWLATFFLSLDVICCGARWLYALLPQRAKLCQDSPLWHGLGSHVHRTKHLPFCYFRTTVLQNWAWKVWWYISQPHSQEKYDNYCINYH